MGKVIYTFPVADVCGKIDRNSKVAFAHRGDTKYTMLCGKRSTPFSQLELDRQLKFKNAVAATRQRMLDPDQSLLDQIAFSQQSKYKTLYRYVFNQVYASLDA